MANASEAPIDPFPKLVFTIHQMGSPDRTETFTQDVIKIGKLPSSHLRIEDDNVSRMHAVIETTRDGEVFVLDLGAPSGTIVNGRKINKCKLENGDELLFGDTRLSLEIPGAPKPEPKPKSFPSLRLDYETTPSLSKKVEKALWQGAMKAITVAEVAAPAVAFEMRRAVVKVLTVAANSGDFNEEQSSVLYRAALILGSRS